MSAIRIYKTGLPPGHIYGFTLANNASDATNDIDIAPGACRDSLDAQDIRLASSLTKRLDASWAAGTNQGGLDTGAISNTTYHVHAILNISTGAVDVLFSASATAPTMPSGYGYARRIGSIIRSAGSILEFRQSGDRFYLVTIATNYNSTSARAKSFLALTVPTGIMVYPMLTIRMIQNAAGDSYNYIFPSEIGGAIMIARVRVAGEAATACDNSCMTNTSGQIYFQVSVIGSLLENLVQTVGWIDRRGQD